MSTLGFRLRPPGPEIASFRSSPPAGEQRLLAKTENYGAVRGQPVRILSRVIDAGIPEEYQRFLGHVRGQAVIFGRKSFEIFGPDLPDSQLFVVSRSGTALPGAKVFGTVDAAIEAARATGRSVFCAGGATLYALTLPVAEALYLSILKGVYEGDAYFPIFDETVWRITRQEDHPEFEFRVYQR